MWFRTWISERASPRCASQPASVKCEDVLRETLTEKQKEQFALCGERRNELLTVFEKEAFIRGFKLGARMAAEVLSDG